jgi:hypothetical protein
MKPIETAHTNDILRGDDRQGVYDLPIARGQYESGQPFVESAWMLEESERAHIAQTGVVYVNCYGHTHPPIALAVFSAANPAEVAEADAAQHALELDLLRRAVCAALDAIFTLRRETGGAMNTPESDMAILRMVQAHNALTVATGDNNLVDLEGEGVCRVCGCTDQAACPGGCAWVDDAHTLCSQCGKPCPTCAGRGHIAYTPCDRCHGTGVIEHPPAGGEEAA